MTCETYCQVRRITKYRDNPLQEIELVFYYEGNLYGGGAVLPLTYNFLEGQNLLVRIKDSLLFQFFQGNKWEFFPQYLEKNN